MLAADKNITFYRCGFLHGDSFSPLIRQPQYSIVTLASLLFLGLTIIIATTLIAPSWAQVPSTPVTPSGLNTQVSEPINLPNNVTQFNITGGARAGTNLFHSFGEFSVPTNNIANFLNTTPELPTSNILARVTGNSPSSLFGTINTLSYGSANLFLMNPAGIIFGPTASLNVGGSVTFTTANNLRLENAGIFHVDPVRPSVLTSTPVASFGFLGSNVGTITVQGSHLSILPDQGISFVAGNIRIEANSSTNSLKQEAILSSPSGHINLVSVASPGEILAPNLEPSSTMALGSITLSQGSTVDVSGDKAGTIRIRGGQLTLTDGILSANNVNTNGAATAIDINITGNLSITDTDSTPSISAKTSGSGDAGSVQIAAGNIEATTTSGDSFTLIDTHTSGEGRAGHVRIISHADSETGNILVSGTDTTGFRFVDSGTRGPGEGGNITLTAKNINFNQASIRTGDSVGRTLRLKPSGSAGNITMTADSIELVDSVVTTEAFAASTESQHAGDIDIRAHDIHILNGQFGATGSAGGGAISIDADRFVTDFSFFETTTMFGQGKDITVTSPIVELTNGSALINSSLGDGNAGNIYITATDHVSFIGDLGTNPQAVFQPSGLFSNSFGNFGVHGEAGNISITTPRLEMVGGRINAITQTSGNGGNVTLDVSNFISISGEFTTDAEIASSIIPSIFDIGPLAPSGIVTSTIGGACSSQCGNAGNIFIKTGALSIQNGGRIDSGTSSSGLGGLVTISETDTISLSGTLSDGTPVGVFSRAIGTSSDAGAGGNITLTAGQSVTIQNGASVSASSAGPGNAGTITINAGQQLDVLTGSITTQATKASGGNIDIRAIDRIRFVNSTVSTSVLAEDGKGGNIFIDPNVVILEGSEVTAKAVGGAGGNITFVTPLFLADSVSLGLLSAKAESGLNGTVLIQSPISNLSGAVGQLVSKTSPPQVLLQNRCIALAGREQSTFILAGRDALPSEPGGWLSSPVAMEQWTGEVPEDHVSRLMVRSRGLNTQPLLVISKDEPTVLSLRRLTPPGFLVRSFAVSAATGCSS